MKDWQKKRYGDAKECYRALMELYPFTTEDLPGEIWIDVDSSKCYQASNYGRIKSFKHHKVTILKPSLGTSGRLQIAIRDEDNKAKQFPLRRLIANLFLPNPEGKSIAAHMYNFRFDCSVWNLMWSTPTENHLRSVANGTTKSGDACDHAKLSNEQVRWCRDHYQPRHPEFGMLAMARNLGVKRDVVKAALHGETYKNAGGKIHGGYVNRIPDEIRNEIRRLYVRGSREFGSTALAKRFGCSQTVVSNIIREQQK